MEPTQDLPAASQISNATTSPVLTALSLPGKFSDKIQLAVTFKAADVVFLALFSNGLIGQYDTSGQLMRTIDAKQIQNIDLGNYLTAGAVKFSLEGQETVFLMDIAFSSKWTMPGMAVGGGVGVLAMSQGISKAQEFFKQVERAQTESASDQTASVPPSLSVPDYVGKNAKTATALLWIGGAMIILTVIALMVTGQLFWFLGLLGLLCIVGGVVRRKRLS